jgi:hypothetical protein
LRDRYGGNVNKFIQTTLLTFALLMPVSGFAVDSCIVKLNIGLMDASTKVQNSAQVNESRSYPIYSGYCDGTAGISITTKGERAYFYTPMVNDAVNSARRASGMNFLSGSAFENLRVSGRVSTSVYKQVNGVTTLVRSLNYFCTETSCALESRPLCGLFRGGTDQGTNMIASPNPATSVASTDAACVSYCNASGTQPGDLCMRYPVIIKKY